MIKRKNGKKKGFSLIELIIVLAVMAIIALIAIPNLSAVKDKSKEKADDQSCTTIERTVKTIIAGDVVSADEIQGSYRITFDSDGKPVFKTVTVNGNDETIGDVITEMSDALKDVKKPNNGTKFEFVVNSQGDVECDVK